MEAIKLCRLDTPIIFIEARINLSRFVVTGCAAKTSARSEERFSRNAETDLVCRLLLEKTNAEAPELHDMVARLAQASGLPKPRVSVIEADATNAFATGIFL